MKAVHYAEPSNGNRTYIDAVNPPETEFGFLYFSHQVPPYKPEHTLILGYGFGVTAELMRKVWGPGCKITAVDLRGYQKEGAYEEHKMEVMDAWDFIKQCTDGMLKTRFDYILVDLWEGDKVNPMIYRDEFAVRLREMSKNLVSINQPKEDFKKLKPLHDYGFKYERFVDVENNRVSFWRVNE